jgi:hypothetical protein
MNAKTALQVLFIVLLNYANYAMIVDYQHEFVVDNFNISKILDQKYRCIRFYSGNMENKYLLNKCQNYDEDYQQFKSDRTTFIYKYYIFNIVMTSLFLVFHKVF